MIQRNTKPSFGWKLKGTANKIANHVRMTHQKCVGITLLGGFSTVEVLPESSFNSASILEELLEN
jgi:hypothetical protein